jgi:hypothetical protein
MYLYIFFGAPFIVVVLLLSLMMTMLFVLSSFDSSFFSLFLFGSSPPSYCWIGNALSIGSDEQTRVILTNSVMDEVRKKKNVASESGFYNE